jgi:hypothetical protein
MLGLGLQLVQMVSILAENSPSTGFSPREGPDYLVYVSATGAGEGIWKVRVRPSTRLTGVGAAWLVSLLWFWRGRLG